MADGGGNPLCGCGVDILSSGVELTRSELTEGEESALGLGEKRDLASDILGLKSWVNL